GQGQAELGTEAGRVAPAARPLGGELDAYADDRTDVQLLGVADDQLELGEFFDDGDDVLAQLAGQDRHLDELVVLEAVADDRGAVAVGDRQDREQFRFGAGFEAELVVLADIDDLLDEVALLVDLDRVDADVVAQIAELADGRFERVVD